MRFISSLLVATLAATTLTTSIAAACGGYDPAPRVLAVSTHGLMANGKWTNRSFVVLEQEMKIEGNAKWRPLAPHTYDATQILTLSSLASPMEVTLVGPAGVRIVKTEKQVALSRSWHIGYDKTRAALEVPAGDERFEIAIVGRATDAKWRELDYSDSSASIMWWLAKQGYSDVEYPTRAAVRGTDLEIVMFSKGGKSTLLVRQGDDLIGSASGAALGAVTTQGRSFLVFNALGQLGTLELPVTARS